MRIAYLSYEYPPETGGGGIGTYLSQITRLLAEAGHQVVVFAGSVSEPFEMELAPNLLLKRIRSAGSCAFRGEVVEVFAECHQNHPFDVIEGCDFDASALDVKRAFPEIPYVVKLHSPRFVIDELQYEAPDVLQRMRMWFGALRQGKRLNLNSIKDEGNAKAERECVRIADEIASPSKAIADLVIGWGGIDPEKVSVFPYCYNAPNALLEIPVGGRFERVTFLGRIEKRKGVEDLAAAVPLVLKCLPRTHFRFVGRPMIEARTGVSYEVALKKRLGAAAKRVEFTGPVPPSEVEKALGETDILVAPSHWESFGLVCCEGMAAGRAVIGSSAGGMAEILDSGSSGVVVPPQSPEQLAEVIIRLMGSPDERASLGAKARQRVCEVYSSNSVLPLQIASYERAIRRFRFPT